MLILIAHGSPNPEWRAAVERLTASIQADVGPDKVRLAYMECSPPTLPDVICDAAEQGVEAVRVLPLFLADAGHVDRNIRPLVDQVRRAHREMRVELLPALSGYEQFRALISDIALGKAR